MAATNKKNIILRKYFILLCFAFLFVSEKSLAQVSDSTIIQFSGVIVSDDSLKPVPFASIMIKDTWKGSVSDIFGFFSFAAHKGDRIVFSAMGFKTATFIIPDTIKSSRYSMIQIMRSDTLLLNETVIYPWPTYEQFKKAFVSTNIPDDALERARKNIVEIEKRVNLADIPMDGSMNFRNSMTNKVNQLYYAGQMPPNNLLNPISWAKFIKAWKEGKFKAKRKND